MARLVSPEPVLGFIERPSGVYVLGVANDAAVKTDTDSLETVLYRLSIPARRLGRNDSVRVTARWSVPNTTLARILRVAFGGTVAWTGNSASVASQVCQVLITNRNSRTDQLGVNTAAPGLGTNGGAAIATLAIDTAQPVDLTLSAQFPAATGTGANSITLHSVLVEHIKV